MRRKISAYYQVGLSVFSFVRHTDVEAVLVSWISSGRAIILQTLQMPLSALSRMTTICTISSHRFLPSLSLQPNPFCYFLLAALAYVDKQSVSLAYPH